LCCLSSVKISSIVLYCIVLLWYISISFCSYCIMTLLSSGFPWYLRLPCVKGRYLYLIICLICRFIVKTNKIQKYMTRIGQNTGTLNISKKVQKVAITTDLEHEYQNLNSGSFLINGLNSSSRLVGSPGPSSSSDISEKKISIFS